MYQDIGKVYKQIRTSKGFTQKEVCGDWMSRSNLSKFESGQSMTSYQTMDHLLRKIDMTFEEFNYLYEINHSNLRQKIIHDVTNYLSLYNTKKLKELVEMCEEYLDTVTNDDLAIKNIQMILNIIIEIRQGNKNEHAQQLSEILWKEIEDRDTWYESELRILSTILFYFPIESLKSMTDKILYSLDKYKHYKDMESHSFSILTNLAGMYLWNNYFNDCWRITNRAFELARKLKRYDQLGFSQVRLGICRHDEQLITQGLQLLELTGELEFHRILTNEVRHFHRSDF